MKTFSLQPFQDDIHKPFLWESETVTSGKRRIALLLHGFPGTPAEMRPLAEKMHAAGWSVRGLLLPGFGQEIATLAEHRAEDWVQATVDEIRRLRQTYDQVALVGFSMGGAVAIAAAAEEAPDELVVIAPFWTLTTGWQDWIWPILRLIFRTIRPFKNTDFSDPEARRNVQNFLPDVDLDDPDAQQAVREIEISASILDELRRIGRMAYSRIGEVTTSALVIQGMHDEVVLPQRTKKMLSQARPGIFTLKELDGGHHVILADRPSLPVVADWVLAQIDRPDPNIAPEVAHQPELAI